MKRKKFIEMLRNIYLLNHEEIIEYKIDELLNLIDDFGRRDKMYSVFMFVNDDMKETPASVKYHQNFKGGLYIHTMHVMNYALKEILNHPVEYKDISIDSAIIVSFIHDLGKIGKYSFNQDFEFESNAKHKKYRYKLNKQIVSEETKVMNLLSKFSFTLNDNEMNALDMAHGGWASEKLKMNKLAYLINIADLKGSQIVSEHCNYKTSTKLKEIERISFYDMKTMKKKVIIL